MTFPLTFTIDGPPVGKERPRRGANGHWYTPKKTLDYERKVAMTFLRTFRKKLGPPANSLSIVYYSATKRVCDGDNALKIIADALTGLAWNNDRGIGMSAIYGGIDRERPRVEVTLR